MEQRGYVEPKMKSFIKQGVMFRVIKHSIFGIREDDIQTRLKLIHAG
jgi:hypothetical protein